LGPGLDAGRHHGSVRVAVVDGNAQPLGPQHLLVPPFEILFFIPKEIIKKWVKGGG
jgi:hypothetical protein